MSTHFKTSQGEGIDITDSGDGVYYTQHDMGTDGLTVTLSIAMSEITGEPVDEFIPNFAKYADPDALDSLFRARAGGQPRKSGGMVRLEIRGHTISVYTNGDIKIETNSADE